MSESRSLANLTVERDSAKARSPSLLLQGVTVSLKNRIRKQINQSDTRQVVRRPPMVIKKRFKYWKIGQALETGLEVFLGLTVVVGIFSLIKVIFWG